MKRKIIEGLIIAGSLFGLATTGFTIPLSFTLSGTVNDGVVWDLNTGSSRPRNVANDISGLDFTMTLTSLQYPSWNNRYGFKVEMVVPGYSFDAPGQDFYMLNDVMKVLETGAPGSSSYRFGYDGSGDHMFSVVFNDDGTGRIDWAAIGYSKTSQQRLGAYSLRDTDFNWTAPSGTAVPVPEPGSMLLFSIGTLGIAGYRFSKK